MPKNKLKVLYVSPEVMPFAKVGGLADVAASMPKALLDLGVDIRLVMPKYGDISEKKYDLGVIIDSFTVQTGEKHHFPRVYEGKLINTDVPIYFIDEKQAFDRERIYNYEDDCQRFCFFDKAVLEMCKNLSFKPDVIHINDWHTSLIPVFLKTLYKFDPFFKDVKIVMSIHNIQYQGAASLDILQCAQIDKNDLKSLSCDAQDGDINYLYEGIANSDYIHTVSEMYAKEILTHEYGMGMEGLLKEKGEKLVGVINGIDIDLWNPKKDKKIASQFDSSSIQNKQKCKEFLQKDNNLPVSNDIPLFGMVTRIAGQKGFDILLPCLEELLKISDFQLVVLGTGDKGVENALKDLEKKYTEKISANILFDETVAHQIYAGSDFFLMPSQFEPCGLGQMIAMRYGTIPVVRKTGGLADTVDPFQNESEHGDGFVFEDYTSQALKRTIERSIDVYKDDGLLDSMRKTIMKKDFSWNNSAKKYLELYKKMITL